MRILSTISSVYDPLGAVSPVILNVKQILQALCHQNVSWDDPMLWEKWRTELPRLETDLRPIPDHFNDFSSLNRLKRSIWLMVKVHVI